jgi:hypothetical protein
MTKTATTSEIAPKMSRMKVNCVATDAAELARSMRRWSPVVTRADGGICRRISPARRVCVTPDLAATTISS